MIGSIKKQMRIQSSDMRWMFLILLGSIIFGKILFVVIQHFDHEVDTYFPLGTIMGILVLVIVNGILVMVGISIYFNTQVSMGCTRKDFFISFYASEILWSVAGLAMLILFNVLDDKLSALMYPQMKNEIILLPYLLKWGLPVAVAVILVGGLCGALVMRFGRIAFWVLWGIWMVGCVLGPQIADAADEAPGSVFGLIGGGIKGVVMGISANIWMVLILVLCVVSVTVSWMILRKQQVNS